MSTIQIPQTTLSPVGSVSIEKLFIEIFTGMGEDFNESTKDYAISMGLVKYSTDCLREIIDVVSGLGAYPS